MSELYSKLISSVILPFFNGFALRQDLLRSARASTKSERSLDLYEFNLSSYGQSSQDAKFCLAMAQLSKCLTETSS